MDVKRIVFLIVSLLMVYALCHAQVQVIEQRVVVAKEGKADFRTIQEAINDVRDHSQIPAVIYVKAGVYPEKLVIPSWKKNIHIIGEGRDKVVVTNADYSGQERPFPDFTGNAEYSTYTSYTVLVQATDCVLENLTIENTAGPVGQAVALHLEADRCAVVNCAILGHQDTLYLAKDGRNYFADCFIVGTTDFIFGEATAVFDRCTIKSLSNSYITAASTTSEQAYGFVFRYCRLIAADSVNKVFLGRPWRPFAKTVFIESDLGAHIVAEGWHAWPGDAFFPNKEKTVFYAEYGSSGPGAMPNQRVAWSHQLTRKAAERYTLGRVLGPDTTWLPPTRVTPPDSSGITGIRDSNFTRAGELKRMRMQYPDIKLVTEPESSSMISRNVVYREADGMSLVGDVYRIEEYGDRIPGVLVIHGGGWRSGDKAQLGGLAYRLASAGYVCFAINYRLSTQALYPAGVHDVEAALQWMKANADSLGIDRGKIVVLGFSAGGQLAALVGAMQGKDEVAAIVDIDGILAFIHPESREGNDTKARSAATNWFGYTKMERPDLWHEASALSYVSQTTPPTLFVNSSVDRMHAGRNDFIDVLDQWGIYHETKTFADAPHSFCLFEPWFTPMSVTVIDFLDKVFNASSVMCRIDE